MTKMNGDWVPGLLPPTAGRRYCCACGDKVKKVGDLTCGKHGFPKSEKQGERCWCGDLLKKGNKGIFCPPCKKQWVDNGTVL